MFADAPQPSAMDVSQDAVNWCRPLFCETGALPQAHLLRQFVALTFRNRWLRDARCTELHLAASVCMAWRLGCAAERRKLTFPGY